VVYSAPTGFFRKRGIMRVQGVYEYVIGTSRRVETLRYWAELGYQPVAQGKLTGQEGLELFKITFLDLALLYSLLDIFLNRNIQKRLILPITAIESVDVCGLQLSALFLI
jgi:hypothetical protein